MYTNLHHDDIYQEINELIQKHLNNNWGYNIINNKCYLHQSDYAMINANKLKHMLLFILNNCYFKVGQTIYKQNIGIPMGIDCAPQLANLFLHSLEHKYMIKTIHTNYKLAKSLSNTGRYIDDLSNFNNKFIFNDIKRDIYPNTLDLIQINDSHNAADVLDISITIKNNKFETKLYDKRDYFNFNIISMPDANSNVPTHMCYSVFEQQIARYSRICSHYNDFRHTSNKLIKKLKTTNYQLPLLYKYTNKAIKKYKICDKYNLTASQMTNDIFTNHSLLIV